MKDQFFDDPTRLLAFLFMNGWWMWLFPFFRNFVPVKTIWSSPDRGWFRLFVAFLMFQECCCQWKALEIHIWVWEFYQRNMICCKRYTFRRPTTSIVLDQHQAWLLKKFIYQTFIIILQRCFHSIFTFLWVIHILSR